MSELESDMLDAVVHSEVHLLDVGVDPYGDALLCRFGPVTVMIDGGHPGSYNANGVHVSLPDQLANLLQQQPPFNLDLLIISHAHLDHIGCLPRLVKEDKIRFRYALVPDPDYSWGHVGGMDAALAASALAAHSDAVRQVMAGLREHPRPQALRDATPLADFLSDAAGLEERYRTMLDTLATRGTKVIRQGRNSASGLHQYLTNKQVGLQIVGPSKAQLEACARLLNHGTVDALQRASDFFRLDSQTDAATVYRQLLGGSRDDLDAADRQGPPVNLQSIVTVFEYKNRRFLFAGDMQFEKPEVSDETVIAEVHALRTSISQLAPYSFAKLSHHGSYNAFSQEILDELGQTTLFGICAGEQSTAHPSPRVLKVLRDNTESITWVRTDHNRLSSYLFGSGKPSVEITVGKLNDPKPNKTDEFVPEPPQPATTTAQPASAPPIAAPTVTQPVITTTRTVDHVEVSAKIPHTATRVTITVDVEPRAASLSAPAPPLQQSEGQSASAPNGEGAASESGAADRASRLRIGGGRQLPPLLFVTSREKLIANIGRAEAERVLSALRAQNQPLYDALPADLNDAAVAAAQVERELGRHAEVKGIVLLGGYDAVPSQRFDCLPPAIRMRVTSGGDPDNFVVWSDDVYAKRGGTGKPLLPVSRIPDGRSAELVFAALQANSKPSVSTRWGLRNVMRPFADRVFDNIHAPSGISQMLRSEPITHGENFELEVDQVYLMLHGYHGDATRFWGEQAGDYVEAFNIANIPNTCKPVAFTGCCWGALTVDTPAGRARPAQPIAPKTPDSSIALRLLANGALAVVGCTGAHYSPDVEPYNFFGGPMHEAFWRHLHGGSPPARALFEAKMDYLAGMPHERRDADSQAIEFKILWQYTCLGLGW